MVEDKKVPMAVIYEYDGYSDGGPLVDDVAHCPTCAYRFEEGREPWGRKYCPECGQRIKWKWEG